MKTLFYASILFLLTSTAFAQKEKTTTQQLSGFTFGPGLTLGIPLGTLIEDYSIVAGIGASAKYFISPKFSLGLNVSYLKFGIETFDYFPLTLVPMTVSSHFYFGNGNFRPYAGVDLGTYFWAEKYLSPGYTEEIDAYTFFGAGPVFGFLSGKNEKRKFNFSLGLPYVFSQYEATFYLSGNCGVLFFL